MWCQLPELPPNLDVRMVEDLHPQRNLYSRPFKYGLEGYTWGHTEYLWQSDVKPLPVVQGKRFSADILTEVYLALGTNPDSHQIYSPEKYNA